MSRVRRLFERPEHDDPRIGIAESSDAPEGLRIDDNPADALGIELRLAVSNQIEAARTKIRKRLIRRRMVIASTGIALMTIAMALATPNPQSSPTPQSAKETKAQLKVVLDGRAKDVVATSHMHYPALCTRWQVRRMGKAQHSRDQSCTSPELLAARLAHDPVVFITAKNGRGTLVLIGYARKEVKSVDVRGAFGRMSSTLSHPWYPSSGGFSLRTVIAARDIRRGADTRSTPHLQQLVKDARRYRANATMLDGRTVALTVE